MTSENNARAFRTTLSTDRRFIILFALIVCDYRIQQCMYTSPPWGGFPSPISGQPRGRQHRTIRVRKALSETLPAPTFSAPTTVLPTAVELNRAWQNRSRGCVGYTPRLPLHGSEVHETHAVGDNLYTPCTISFLFPINSRLIKSHSHSSFS